MAVATESIGPTSSILIQQEGCKLERSGSADLGLQRDDQIHNVTLSACHTINSNLNFSKSHGIIT